MPAEEAISPGTRVANPTNSLAPEAEKPQVQQGHSRNPSSVTQNGHPHFLPDERHFGTGQTTPNTAGKEPPHDDRIELLEEDCEDELGYAFPTWKKWMILTIVVLVQTSMNFNTSLYSNGIQGISDEFGVSLQDARWGAATFLITYAFGCELWAPWSEEFGRWIVLQASLTLVNIWCIPVGIAPNFATIIVGRALGGISTAGGSVTLAMIADMFDVDSQAVGVAYVVFSSVGGSVLGPIVGGFVEKFLAWRWTIWIQLIFSGFTQILHFFLVPETRTTVLMDRIAKKRRKQGISPNVYGPGEMTPWSERISWKEIGWTMLRPFRMFLTEPIVMVLSLLSGFSDALIFMQIQSFSLVYDQWGFDAVTIGLSFLPILVGYFIAWALFIPAIKRNAHQRHKNPMDEHAQYEGRMDLLLWLAPCLPIGIALFAATTGGPPVHWIGSMFGSALIGIANYAIYMATIDYMICAYGPYSASATGGNGWSRDFLAGVLTVPATPFYTNIGRSRGGSFHLQIASGILAIISAVLVGAVYIIYWKGPQLRLASPFAQSLAHQASATADRRSISTAGGGRHGSIAVDRPDPAIYRHRNSSRISHIDDSWSRRSSYMGSAGNSRRNSFVRTPGASRPGSARNSLHLQSEPTTPVGHTAGRPRLGPRVGSYGFGPTPKQRGQAARENNDLIRETTLDV